MILCILREKDSFGLEEHSGIDLSGNTDAEHDISNNTQGSNEGVEHQTSSVGEIHRTHVNESIGDIQKMHARNKWKVLTTTLKLKM